MFACCDACWNRALGGDFLEKPTNHFWAMTKMRKQGLGHRQFMNRKSNEISWMNRSLCIIQPAVLISALRTVPVPTAANSKTPFDFSRSRTEPSEVGPGACFLCNALFSFLVFFFFCLSFTIAYWFQSFMSSFKRIISEMSCVMTN